MPEMNDWKPWLLVLICCGRSDGTWPCNTWDEADALRESYMSAPDHDRQAILRAVPSPHAPGICCDDSGMIADPHGGLIPCSQSLVELSAPARTWSAGATEATRAEP